MNLLLLICDQTLAGANLVGDGVGLDLVASDDPLVHGPAELGVHPIEEELLFGIGSSLSKSASEIGSKDETEQPTNLLNPSHALPGSY